jgi:hypothetical protein
MTFIINSYILSTPVVGWRPTDLGADLVAWWDANNSGSITKDGSNLVSKWEDLSTNGYDLEQSTGTAQPTWESSVLNSKPGIKFDTNDFMTNLSIATSQPVCIVFVIKNPATSITSNEYVYDSEDGSSNRIALLKESTFGADDYVLFAGTVRDTGYGYETTGEINIACYNNPSSSSSFRYNGAQSGYASAGAQTFDGITIGSRFNNTDFLNAHICEMFIVNKILTAGDLTNIDDYLKPKWGITY